MEVGGDNPTRETRGNGSYSNDDGTGGYGGGTVSTTKASWNGLDGYINGECEFLEVSKFLIKPDFDFFYYNSIVKNADNIETICVNACGGGWDNDDSPKGTIYNKTTREIVKYYGQNATKRGNFRFDYYVDLAGGGAGYYGGECSSHYNAGAGGGSAYADITGVVKAVTDIQGYGGYEDGNGAEMKGRYGNGKIIISQ